ncbi:hypothetical protein K493DRAFT_298692 [Basidiobolus meristosporus CBS 931.73]|uniref:PAS domain-containing protein n=1 Tax=Basidiobolus meristosporus CBS 931.73 TaxID=1314790 RepID=A0A1Y1YRV9_9FUNG|nr:hypothetical protein K493DRAFT_298692 [Basidiobolus meristosporus CBS 931.73]|eukprot:ORY00768.1 hypothetical protein K493DRAFT_298692 [Basidiobolus meristosporus CBS 931.73]
MPKASFISIASVDSMQMIYLSDGCKDVLGFSGQQWVGKNAENWFHPEDRRGLYMIIKTCVELQKIATLVYFRVLSAKGYVLIEASFNYCYDIIVSSNRLLREADYPELFGTIPYQIVEFTTFSVKDRTCLAEDIITIWNTQSIHVLGAPNAFSTSKELHQALSKTTSKTPNSPPEVRVCIIVDHNLEGYPIVFCSRLSTDMLGSSPEELKHTSLFEHVHYEDLNEVREELKSVIYEESVGNKIEFTWTTPTFQHIELQAVITHTDDGLIFILRVVDQKEFFLPICEAFQ